MALLASRSPALADSVYAVCTGNSVNETRLLVSDAKEAEAKFGRVSDDYKRQVSATIKLLDAYSHAEKGTKWTGPALDQFSAPGSFDYRSMSNDLLRTMFGHLTVYEPSSLGSARNQDYVLVMSEYGPSEDRKSEKVAVVFVFEKATLKRVIFNFQPWIQSLVVGQVESAFEHG